MFKRIGVLESKGLLDNDMTAMLVDIRDVDSYNEGHVTGAFHLSQEVLPSFLRDTEKHIPVLIMCYHGNSSQVVAQLLSGQGFSDVYSIDGGYEAWVNNVYPL